VSPDSSDSLGIIIYFLHRKYPVGKAAKGLMPQDATDISYPITYHQWYNGGMVVLR